MKKLVLSISLLLILSSSNFSQQNFWQQTNGPNGGKINSLAINSSGDIFCGTNFSGIFRSPDNGENWVKKNNGLTNLNILSVEINSNDFIFVGTGSGIFRSTDNGETWLDISNGLIGSIFPLAISTNNQIFAGCGTKIFRSTNNGDNWIDISAGLSSYYSFTVLEVNSLGHIFAANKYDWTFFDEDVFRSTDNGDSWVELTELNPTEVLSLSFNSDNTAFVGTKNGILRSTDNGESWTAINNGLTAYNVLAIEFNSNNDIFIGTSYGTGGVFRSTDNGENWIEINNGLTVLVIPSLAINSNGFIFAGSQDNSVYRSINSTTSVESINILPTAFLLNQNYPNPFNPSTKISWQAPIGGWQTLKVYDVLGNEVATLVNEYRPAGSYEIEFNPSSIKNHTSSSVYFYRLQAGDFVETKKMILLK